MTNTNDFVSNNRLCPICGGDHNVFVLNLEDGNHVIPRPFFYERAAKVKADTDKTNLKRIATKIDPADIFWTAKEDGF